MTMSKTSSTLQSFDILPQEPYYFDAEDFTLPPKPGKVMHLSIDYQTIGKGEKGRQVCFTSASKVNDFLSDLDYNQLIGNDQTFDTLTYALTSVEKLQHLEALQPHFT